MPRLTVIVAALLGAALAAPAAANGGDEAMALDAALLGTWRITGTDEAAIPAGAEATMTVASDGAVAGVWACNRYATTLRQEGGAILFGPPRGTRKACDEPLMQAEYAILRALERASGYRSDGSRLELVSGELVLMTLTRAP